MTKKSKESLTPSPKGFAPDARVDELIASYPKPAQTKLTELRRLILRAASKVDDLGTFEETLKWGEPSYVAKHGSTVRIDWKAKTPEQVAIYFKCTSKLVVTFKEVFGDTFSYEKTRALVFGLNDRLPQDALERCVTLALRYHRVKHLPLLGAGGQTSSLSE